jgi:hypothetical protein
MLSIAECFRPLLRLTDSDCPSSAAERLRKGTVEGGSSGVAAGIAVATVRGGTAAESDGRMLSIGGLLKEVPAALGVLRAEAGRKVDIS